jgi:hypothetical protein
MPDTSSIPAPDGPSHHAAPTDLTRRTFLGWLAVLVPAARTLRGPPRRTHVRLGELDAAILRPLASAVLPTELGQDGARRAADAFQRWARNYKAGAELNHGYGSARIQTAGPDPSTRWILQLKTLDDDARRAHTQPFAAITGDQRRTIVRAQLTAERNVSLGNVGSAQHVAVALLSHFYASPEATDLCYEAVIGKNLCRPLSQSAQHPVPLRRAGGRGPGGSPTRLVGDEP